VKSPLDVQLDVIVTHYDIEFYIYINFPITTGFGARPQSDPLSLIIRRG